MNDSERARPRLHRRSPRAREGSPRLAPTTVIPASATSWARRRAASPACSSAPESARRPDRSERCIGGIAGAIGGWWAGRAVAEAASALTRRRRGVLPRALRRAARSRRRSRVRRRARRVLSRPDREPQSEFPRSGSSTTSSRELDAGLGVRTAISHGIVARPCAPIAAAKDSRADDRSSTIQPRRRARAESTASEANAGVRPGSAALIDTSRRTRALAGDRLAATGR